MKERALVAFTILAQMAIGTFWLLRVLNRLSTVNLLILTAIMLVALAASFLHLGSPFNAWRAFSGWRSSWLSREVLCTVLFTALIGGLTLAAGSQIDLAAVGMWLAALCGLVLLISMAMTYRLHTVPMWKHWATAASFSITTVLLGSLLCGLLIGGRPWLAAGAIVLLGAHQVLAWRGPRVDRWRQLILALRILAVSVLVIVLFVPHLWIGWLAAFLLALGSEVMARMLFYEMRKPRSVWRFAARSALSHTGR